MTNEDQIAALFAEANPVPSLDMLDPLEPLAIDPLESPSQRSSVMTDLKTDKSKVVAPAKWPRVALLAGIPVLLVAVLVFLGDTASNVATPAAPAASVTTAPLTDTTTWATYRSDRYGFSIGYPSDWTVSPADHDWTLAEDANDVLSSGQEMFRSPNRDVRVSAWSVALDPGTSLETWADVEGWVEQYCQHMNDPSCTEVPERAVELCLEARDCHPGLLLPFREDVQAFFPGMSDDASGWNQMIVVAIWRSDSHPSVAPYGGARRFMEAFLSTMGVCPADNRTLC